MDAMDREVVEVLKEIRDEAMKTNARLDQTNARLDQTTVQLDTLTEAVNALGRRQTESELRLATEVLSLADVTRDVRDLLSRKLDDHHLVVDLEKRVQVLESRQSE